MIKTPLINIRPILSCGGCNCCNCCNDNEDAVEPNIITIEDGEDPNDLTFVRGDLLDALSVNVYFNDMKSQLLNVLDVVSTQLRNHVSDKNVHTSQTEKAYWNNKLDKTEFSELINGLRDLIPTNAITSATLADALEALGLLDATHNPVIPTEGEYVKKNSFLGTINGVDFYQGRSIVVGGGDGTDQTTINNITNQVLNSISYTPNITSSWDNSYEIGTLKVGDNKNITLYGVDTYGGDGTGGNKDYSIQDVTFNSSNRTLTINQKNAGTKTVTIPGGSGDIVPATSNVLGGIKIGYERGNNDSDRNYAVQLSPDNKAYVYVPWIDTHADDPDNPEEKKDKIITLTESEFNALDQAGELEPDTTYIVLDDETGVVKFICYVDKNGVKHITTMPENTHEELKAEELTLAQWNSMSDADKDMNTIYIVYSGTGANKALVGLGISKVLTRVPVPANGTVVRLTQSEYDNLGANIDEGTLYLIVANNAVVKMYLGSIEIPVGSDNEEAVIKSILTTMFSEKVTWEGDEVKSLNWSIIDVDNPGEFYAATGFEDLVKNTVREAGFISKTDNTNNFAEMFAALVGLNGDIVKKASILASINESGESNVKISADKIDVDGVFNQYAQSPNKKSATQLLSDGSKIAARASVIEDGVLRATEVTTTPGVFEISAVTVDNNDSETSNALFRISTQAKGSEAYIKADSIIFDGNTTVYGKLDALSGQFDSLQANVASFERVYAKTADVNTLLANYATINDLTAESARIDTLEANQLTVDYLTGGTATFKGDVNAKSLQVINNSDNLSIKFTAYDPNTMNWPGLVASGINAGEPVGIIYNQETGHANEPLYFFDFAPVDPGTFSVTPESTYYITAGANNKVTVEAGPTIYKVDAASKAAEKVGKYVIASSDGSVNTRSPLAVSGSNGNLGSRDLYQLYTIRSLIAQESGSYVIRQCNIFKKVVFGGINGGERSIYTDGSDMQHGYIIYNDGPITGSGKTSYVIATAGSPINGAAGYSGQFTQYLSAGNSEIISVANEPQSGNAKVAHILVYHNTGDPGIIEFNAFAQIPNTYDSQETYI